MKINVAFDVPATIANGLASGNLERVGGVIRFADNKQIVAWLQETPNMSNHAAKGIPILSSLLGAVGTNAGTIETLTDVTNIGLDLVDVAVTMYLINRVDQRLAALQNEISAIYSHLVTADAKKKYASIRHALDYADSFLNSASNVNRHRMYPLVHRDLVKTEKYLLEDIKQYLDDNKLSETSQTIDCTILLDWIAAYCTVDFGEDDDAIYQLQKSTTILKPLVQRFVKQLVGANPALFFHESVEDDYLERYIQIRAWLDGDVDVWERVVTEARKDFWNDKSVECLYREARKFLYTWPKLRKNPFYKENIPRAERVIENFQRLEGYAIQIESLEKPYRDYRVISELAAARLADHDDYVLVIDEDTLERLERLSA